MQITVNGEPKALSTPMTVQQLIDNLQLDSRKIAMEKNRVIVPRSTYAQEAIHDGDSIEIVECIGGG